MVLVIWSDLIIAVWKIDNKFIVLLKHRALRELKT